MPVQYNDETSSAIIGAFMPWWLWLLFGLVLAVLELLSPGGFYLIFFGVAAILIGLLGAIGFGGPLWTQWLAFVLFSIVLVLAFRRPMLKMMQLEGGEVDALVGQIATALEPIAPGAVGRAELRGATWSARNLHTAPLAQGQRCRVERVDGLMLFLVPER
jgi:inner membrane protein